VRFFIKFCVCDIGSCFVLLKWVDGRRLGKSEISKAFVGWDCVIFVYGFFIDFAKSQFSAIFHEILRLRIGSWFSLIKNFAK
jgi:hypothetical protein